MKGNRMKKRSNEAHPSVEVLQHENSVEVRFNFQEQAQSDDHAVGWLYDYVRLFGTPSKKMVKLAVIRCSYPSIDDELAVINNRELGSDDAVLEYEAYQSFRQYADDVANEAIEKYAEV